MKKKDKNTDSNWEKQPEPRGEPGGSGLHLSPQPHPEQDHSLPIQGDTNLYGNREIPDHEQDEYGWSQYYGEPFARGESEAQQVGEQQAWQRQGPHTGKGPKGYARPDDRIFEEVCERLTDHGQIDASGIEVDVKKGVVFLRGFVDSGRTKRMVVDTIEHVSGVREIRNALETASDD